MREDLAALSQKALLLMDNFTGQTTTSVMEMLEEQGIVVVMVLGSTTDRLQPLDVSTNKAAKYFLGDKFRGWYAGRWQSSSMLASQKTVKVNMGMRVMKEVGAKWLASLHDSSAQRRVSSSMGPNTLESSKQFKVQEKPLCLLKFYQVIAACEMKTPLTTAQKTKMIRTH